MINELTKPARNVLAAYLLTAAGLAALAVWCWKKRR